MPRFHRSFRFTGSPAQGLVLAAALIFGACNAGAQDQAADDPGAGTAPAAAPAPNAAAPPADTTDGYTVIVGSGPFAGTHQGTGEMNCFTQDGTWGADITLDRERGLSGLMVMLNGVPGDGGSTEDVNLGLTFGQLDDETPNAGGLGIGAASGGGTGRGTVEREGRTAVIRVEGTTFYGAPVSAVVRCDVA